MLELEVNIGDPRYIVSCFRVFILSNCLILLIIGLWVCLEKKKKNNPDLFLLTN